jgi:hypothetical protein
VKIAVCLYGLAGDEVSSTSGIITVEPSRSYRNYMEVLFQGYDVDFFLHSWSVDSKDILLDLYKPKSSIIENQIDFSGHSLEEYSLKHLETYKKIFATEENIHSFLSERYIFNSHSRWYSTSKSLEIMNDYSKDKNLHYDWVFQTRMDLFFRERLPFEKLNNNYFYTSPRFEMDSDLAINDVWFLSNQKNAELFSKIYDNIFDYSIWTHSAAKQHVDSFGTSIEFYPEVSHGRKNYWLMREVLIQEKAKKIPFFKRLVRFILHRILGITSSFESLLKKIILKLS